MTSDWDELCRAHASPGVKYLGLFTSAPALALRGQHVSIPADIHVDPVCLGGIVGDDSRLRRTGIVLQEGDARNYLYVRTIGLDRGASCLIGRLKRPVEGEKEHVLIFKDESSVLVSVIGAEMTPHQGIALLHGMASSIRA